MYVRTGLLVMVQFFESFVQFLVDIWVFVLFRILQTKFVRNGIS